ncbi:MAG: lytic transglycosylase domain-containing protein [Treponema sp.]|nr:lytic transglycosylase domain-containing protein [Treponema sp.]
MRSPLTPSASRRFTTLLLLSFSIGLASCQENGPFGLSEAVFRGILASDDRAAIIALPDTAFDNPGPSGPSAWYFTALWLAKSDTKAIEKAGATVVTKAGAMPVTKAGAMPVTKAGAMPVTKAGAMPVAQAGAAAVAQAAPASGEPSDAKADDMAGPGLSASDALALKLFERAAAASHGFIGSDSRRRLVGLMAEAARALPPGPESHDAWQALLDASSPPEGGVEVEWAHLEALGGLELWPELLGEADRLLHDDIGSPSSRDQAALYARSLADSRLGLARAGTDLADLLAFGQGPWVAKAIALASEPENLALLPSGVIAKARLFQALETRDYAEAFKASIGALPELRASPTRALVGAFGKAWLFSGMSKDGLSLMDSVAARSGATLAGGSPAWTAMFYKARMLVALSRFDEARTILDYLADLAISDKDRDSCLYYALDARLKAIDHGPLPPAKWASAASRDGALAEARLSAIVDSAARWKDPSTYTDLVEPIFRDLLVENNWDEADAFAGRLAGLVSPFMASRLLYVSARARELGLVGANPSRPLAFVRAYPSQCGPARASDGDEAERRYASLLALHGAPGYYLLVASTRLGIDLRPWGPRNSAGPFRFFDPGKSEDDLAATARDLVDFGLPALAWDLAGKSTDALSDDTLLELAKASARNGSFASSMRFANVLANRSGPGFDGLASPSLAATTPAATASAASVAPAPATPALVAPALTATGKGGGSGPRPNAEVGLPGRDVYELLYPRPWNSELSAALGDSNIPQSAAYGLIRSESWFDPGAKSSAGAVGLTQLMPPTAEEIANNLGIRIWSLTLPADNLRLGMSMLHDLFDENDGHILRAASAYNAGRGRLRRWLTESGGYPDDLFLERLSIAETRDYGRKILQATAWYAALYYGKGSSETVRELIAGYPTGK